MDASIINDLHAAAVILAGLCVILSIIYFGFMWTFPRKIQPHEYENAVDQGDQSNVSPRAKKRYQR